MIYTLTQAPETFTGSFFAGPVNLMLELQKLYHMSLEELYTNNISDDDQHVYLRCYFNNPTIFDLYLSNQQWPKALPYFEKKLDRIELATLLLKNKQNEVFVEIGCDRGTFSKFY
jgi:hypothetical protein